MTMNQANNFKQQQKSLGQLKMPIAIEQTIGQENNHSNHKESQCQYTIFQNSVQAQLSVQTDWYLPQFPHPSFCVLI